MTTATRTLGSLLKDLGLAVWVILKLVPTHCTIQVHYGLGARWARCLLPYRTVT